MTFLNPLALVGLAAAAIPVLLHILTLRRLRTIEFSSLRFLKELQRTTIRRLKIRQWLLLLLRTLLVICIVLAFSRPTFRGSLGFGPDAHAASSAVLLMDDTPSMTAAGELGESFSRARAMAQRILDLLHDGDEAVLVPFTAAGTTDLPETFSPVPLVRQAVTDLHSSLASATVEDALRSAARIVSTSRNFNKEIYLLSDMQVRRLESDPAAASERLFDERTRVFVLDVSSGITANVSIEDVQTPDAIPEPGRPLRVLVRLANHGAQARTNHVASLFIDGTRVAQRGIDLPPAGKADVEFTIIPHRSGFLQGLVEIEDDGVEFDNRRAFTINIPEDLRVLLAGTPDACRFIRLALETRLTDSLRRLHLTQIGAEQLGAALTRPTDIVILSDPGPLSQAAARALSDFVRRGGGMLLFPGPHTLPNAYAASFASLGLPSLSGIETAPRSAGNAVASPQIQRVDWEHPLFRAMFEETRLKSRAAQQRREIETPGIRTFARFLPGPRASVVMALGNGVPYMLEEPVGSGRVFVFAVSATPEWSDLPTSALFVPLLHRSAAYAAHQRAGHPAAAVGERVTLTFQRIAAPSVRVIDPAGMEAAVAVTRYGDNQAVQLPSTSLPGVYTIRADGTTLDAIAVAVDRRESDLAAAKTKQLENAAVRLGLPPERMTLVKAESDLARTVTEARFGMELWRHLLIAALVLALAEMIIARDARRAMAELDAKG